MKSVLFLWSLLCVSVAGNELYSCEPPSFVVGLYYTVDVTESMENSGYLDQVRGQDGIMKRLFQKSSMDKFSLATVTSFQDRAAPPYGEGSDFCFRIDTPLALMPSDVGMFSLPGAVGGDDQDAQLTALHEHANGMFPGPWPKVMILFTDGRPHVGGGPGGLPAAPDLFYYNCQNYQYPTIEQVDLSISRRDAGLVLVVRPEDVEYYEDLFSTVSFSFYVVPFSDTTDKTLEGVSQAVDWLVCGPPPCQADSFALQVYHLQDTSGSSYNTLKPVVEQKFPDLLANLSASYAESTFSLAWFSDKGVRPFGQPGFDSCYVPVLPFTSNTADFLNALATLQIASGKDWEESQLESLMKAAEDASAGWTEGDFDDVKELFNLRVIILATDSGYHKNGDYNSPTPAGYACDDVDYPEVATVKSALAARNIFPLFIPADIVTSDYTDLLAELDEGGAVRPISSDALDFAEAISEGLEEICETLTRRLALQGRLLLTRRGE